MAFIVYGAQPLMVKKQLKRIIKESTKDNLIPDVIYFDSKNLDEKDLIEECNQFSLTSELKIVFVENSNFLTRERTKEKFEYTNLLIEYLKNENPNCKLVFSIATTLNLDDKNELVKTIKENGGTIRECKDLSSKDWPIYAKEYFEKKNIKIDQLAINELVNNCEGDLNVFINEAEKLISFKENNISLKDAKEICVKPLSNNVFEILNLLYSNKKSEAIKIWRDLKIQKTEPVQMINIFTSNLIFQEKVLYLSNQGLNASMIASKLKSNPYRVTMTLRQSGNISLTKINKILDDLYELDKSIKHNEVDRFYAFEMFLLNF